jgi:hypothetical protein
MASEVARLRKGWRDGLSNPPYSGSVGFCYPRKMAKIKLLTVAGPLLCHAAQAHRVIRLLDNRRSWGIERPLLSTMIEQGPFSMTEKSPTPMGLQVVGHRGLFEPPHFLLFPEPVGVAFTVQHMAMMEQSVEDGGRDDVVAEDVRPLAKAWADSTA